MASIEPTAEQITALITAAQTDTDPVVMINLLKFAPDGAASYERYGKEVQPHLEKVGASVLYSGTPSQVVIGAEATPWWDAIVVVQYPSRNAFIAMVTDPGYQAVGAHRTNALLDSKLIATSTWQLPL